MATPVVVDAFPADDPDQGGAGRFQSLRLGVDEPAPGLDRIRSPAADGDVEVQPVLQCLVLGSTMRPWPSSSSLTPTARQ